jgi:2-polyprenyl-3-methyl-5-hydroxy-6-metoxy-1,4-benzoquinol methylase
LSQQQTQQADQEWFEAVYSSANHNPAVVPWADLEPNRFLLDWLNRSPASNEGKTAVVVGCGLGDDAEELARRGYTVTAFDVSSTAVEWCKQRFPNSQVTYTVDDLFDLPASWHFDFVLEINTIQSLPVALRRQVIQAIASLVAPEGALLAIGRLAQSSSQQVRRPWPLTRSELNSFIESGLAEVHFEAYQDAEISSLDLQRFSVEYRR